MVKVMGGGFLKNGRRSNLKVMGGGGGLFEGNGGLVIT